jgi:hypothetical protein
MTTEASKRGRNNRSRGLSVERTVRDMLARIMQTKTWRNPSTGSAISDVEAAPGRCVFCGSDTTDGLAVEVKSFQSDIPKWLQRGLEQNESAMIQTSKPGLIVISWVHKAKRRYFGLFELD